MDGLLVRLEWKMRLVFVSTRLRFVQGGGKVLKLADHGRKPRSDEGHTRPFYAVYVAKQVLRPLFMPRLTELRLVCAKRRQSLQPRGRPHYLYVHTFLIAKSRIIAGEHEEAFLVLATFPLQVSTCSPTPRSNHCGNAQFCHFTACHLALDLLRLLSNLCECWRDNSPSADW